MAFSISEFNSQLNKHGVAKNNLFLVTIALPPALSRDLGVSPSPGAEPLGISPAADSSPPKLPVEDLKFFCKAATLPELTVQTVDNFPNTFGTPDRRPSAMQFTQLPTVFMVDSNFKVKEYFHSWMQRIVNYDRQSPMGFVDGRLPFEIAYKSEYSAGVTIEVYSYEQKAITYTYKFEGAFPTSIGETQVSWENAAEIMTLPVTFTYDTMIVPGAKVGKVETTSSRGSGILGSLSALNSFGQAINQIRRPRSIQDTINQFTNAQTIFRNFL